MTSIENLKTSRKKHQLKGSEYAHIFYMIKLYFLAADLTVEVTKSPAQKPESADNLPFGAVFTDHMLEIDWTAENGWGTPEIKPFQNLSLVNSTFSKFNFRK